MTSYPRTLKRSQVGLVEEAIGNTFGGECETLRLCRVLVVVSCVIGEILMSMSECDVETLNIQWLAPP